MKTETSQRFHPYSSNGDTMKRLRKRAGISQERLAAAVGTSRRHMIRLENGEHLPSTPLRDKIADAIEAPRDAIQSADDDEEVASMPLTRDDFELLGELMARLGATITDKERA